MNNSQNISQQELLAREFETWQKQYYDDVYSLFEKRDGQRLVIALQHWEDRFLAFLRDRLPKMVKNYYMQSSPSIMLSYFGDPIENFKPNKSDQIEAFLTQCIEEARKGYLDNYYVPANTRTEHTYRITREKKSLFKSLLTSIFVTIPKTIGRLFFDIFGQGDKAAHSSTIIIGYIAIAVFVLLLLGILSPNTLIEIYRFFFPEPK